MKILLNLFSISHIKCCKCSFNTCTHARHEGTVYCPDCLYTHVLSFAVLSLSKFEGTEREARLHERFLNSPYLLSMSWYSSKEFHCKWGTMQRASRTTVGARLPLKGWKRQASMQSSSKLGSQPGFLYSAAGITAHSSPLYVTQTKMRMASWDQAVPSAVKQKNRTRFTMYQVYKNSGPCLLWTRRPAFNAH
jgi:hypothetical protein